MALLRLNFDIFREITSYLSQPSRSSLMRTCKALYRSPEAGKIVIGGHVVLRSSKGIASFVGYLHAEKKPRGQYVRELWLRPDCSTSFSRRALLALSLCISSLSSLNSIQLHDADLMFLTCPELGVALAKLTSLRDLDLAGVGPETCTVLQALESQLVSISLRWLIRIDEDMDEEFLISDENHAVQRLANQASSLESLSCTNWYTGRDLPDFPTVYPHMRELSIARDDFPHMKPYIRAYPHLTRLRVQTDHASDVRRDTHLLDTVQELRVHRAINIAEQSGQPWVWQELGEFVGCATDLFLLGLTCPINRLRLHTTASVEVSFDMFREVLAMARPKELKVDGYGGLLLDPIHGLIPVLKNPDTRLEHLVADASLSKDHNEIDLAEALEELLAALSTRPLRRLRLFLRVRTLDPTPNGPLIEMLMAKKRGERVPELPPPMPLTRAELSLQSFDLGAYTRRLGEAIPSLTDALIAISGLRGREDELVASIPARADGDIDIWAEKERNL